MVLWTALAGCSGSDDGSTVPACDLPSPYTSWEDPVASALRCGIEGLDAREGQFDYFTMADCETLIAAGESCHSNHPASPYGQIRFSEDDDGALLPTYQLDQDEAILYVGRTPPEARYWGVTHYQYWKVLEADEMATFPSLPNPYATFGSNSGSLNVLTAATTPSSTTPWDDWVAILFTANETTANEVRARVGPVMLAHGHAPEVFNIVPVGLADDADLARLLLDPGYADEELFQITRGYGTTADRDTIVIRVADPVDPADPYLDPARIPAAMFKLTLTERPAYDPFAFPHLPPEDQTGETQGEALRAARDRVADEIRLQQEALGMDVEVVAFDNLPQKTSADCIELRDFCGGNNDDARYLRSRRYQIPDLENDEAAVYVVGVVHDAAGRQIAGAPPLLYSSLSLLNYTNGAGLESRLDRELEGTVRDFFPDGVPGVDPSLEGLLYVQRFSRRCVDGNPSCVPLPTEEPLGVAAADLFWFTERAYLNLTSRTAPHESSVIEPVEVAVARVITPYEAGPPVQHHTKLLND